MLIRTRNAIKTNHNDQWHVQQTTNAKYTKYLHQGYKILQGYKCEVLKIVQQHLKVLKNCYKVMKYTQALNIKLKLKTKYLSFKGKKCK